MKKTFLPDVNVWLAIALSGHAQHPQARRWWLDISNGNVAFCRITQSGFLRLVTNEAAFRHDSLSMRDAWVKYDEFYLDERVVYAREPENLEATWRRLSERNMKSPKLWTDAYLAAFSLAADMEIVTFDRGFAQFNLPACTILS